MQRKPRGRRHNASHVLEGTIKESERTDVVSGSGRGRVRHSCCGLAMSWWRPTRSQMFCRPRTAAVSAHTRAQSAGSSIKDSPWDEIIASSRVRPPPLSSVSTHRSRTWRMIATAVDQPRLAEKGCLREGDEPVAAATENGLGHEDARPRRLLHADRGRAGELLAVHE